MDGPPTVKRPPKRTRRPRCEVCGVFAEHEVDLGYALYIVCFECSEVITEDAENYFVSEIIVW